MNPDHLPLGERPAARQCPYCPEVVYSTEAEATHMQEAHPEIIAERLHTIGEEVPRVMSAHNWARLLIERDDVWGPKVLEYMVKWFEENDSKADDFGRLRIVIDAQKALEDFNSAQEAQ